MHLLNMIIVQTGDKFYSENRIVFNYYPGSNEYEIEFRDYQTKQLTTLPTSLVACIDIANAIHADSNPLENRKYLIASGALKFPLK